MSFIGCRARPGARERPSACSGPALSPAGPVAVAAVGGGSVTGLGPDVVAVAAVGGGSATGLGPPDVVARSWWRSAPPSRVSASPPREADGVAPGVLSRARRLEASATIQRRWRVTSSSGLAPHSRAKRSTGA
ncbi:hypothetical protein [Streptomyces malaysiensis]|uniref:hypothetical protein n=1 Tax=Streptomyces malaysiensis TaxID=92644 RepID=UPI00142EC0FD|nr:hypothetical protein [Streptomyces malaysiensis]